MKSIAAVSLLVLLALLQEGGWKDTVAIEDSADPSSSRSSASILSGASAVQSQCSTVLGWRRSCIIFCTRWILPGHGEWERWRAEKLRHRRHRRSIYIIPTMARGTSTS
jgi:hypothetical protein